jgi:membrane-associated phospholipid phosphatase
VHTLANSPAWQWLWGPTRLIIQAADPVVAVTVLAVSALTVSARRRSLRPLLTAAVAVTLLAVTVVPAKILIGRLSPGQRFLPPGAMGAFPSGHTTTASVCYVLAVLPLLPYLPAWTRRIALAALAVWCLLVGFALVWQNLHWFTDVVAGWALAALIIQATLRLTRAGRAAPGAPPGVADERIASASTT